MGGEVGMSLVVKSSHCLVAVTLMGFRAWGLFCIAIYSFVCLPTEHLLHHFGRDTEVRKLPNEFIETSLCIFLSFCNGYSEPESRHGSGLGSLSSIVSIDWHP